MSTDLATLSLRVDGNTAVLQVEQFGVAASKTAKETAGLESQVAGLAAAFAAYKIGEWVKETLLLGARYETLGVVLDVVGRNAGKSRAEMASYQAELQKTGITAIGARESLAKMAQAQLDMAQASNLARGAQNAAVIGNISSTEAFENLVRGIQTGRVQILHTMGVMPDFEKAYKTMADQVNKTSDTLTEAQRAQARMNATLDALVPIAGAYTAAMGTAGKQLTSTIRYMEDAREKASRVFQPAFTEAVFAYANALKFAGDHAPDVAAGITAVATAIGLVSGALVVYKVAALAAAATPMGLTFTAAITAIGTAAAVYVQRTAVANAETEKFGETLKGLSQNDLTQGLAETMDKLVELRTAAMAAGEVLTSSRLSGAGLDKVALSFLDPEVKNRIKDYEALVVRVKMYEAALAALGVTLAGVKKTETDAIEAAGKAMKDDLAAAVAKLAATRQNYGVIVQTLEIEAKQKDLHDKAADHVKHLIAQRTTLKGIIEGTTFPKPPNLDAEKKDLEEYARALKLLEKGGLAKADDGTVIAGKSREDSLMESLNRRVKLWDDHLKFVFGLQVDNANAETALVEEQLKEEQKIRDTMAKDVQRTFATLFEDIFTKGTTAFASLWATIKAGFLRVVSEMLAANVMQRFAGAMAAMGLGTDPEFTATREDGSSYNFGGGAGNGLKIAGAAVGGAFAGYSVGGALYSPSHSGGQNTAMGALGGAAAGAAVGTAILPGIGTAVGAVAGLVAGLIGAADAAKKANDEMRRLRESLSLSMEALRAQVGGTSSALSTSILQAQADGKALADQARDAYKGGANEAERTRVINEISDLTDARIRQLKDEAAALVATNTQDLAVRRLKAEGKTAEADALALELAQSREMATALQDQTEAGKAYAAALAIVLGLEKAVKEGFTALGGLLDYTAAKLESARVAMKSFAESLIVRGLAAVGNTTASADYSRRFSNANEIAAAVDKYGAASPIIPILKGIQDIEGQAVAIQNAANAAIAAVNAALAKQLAALDKDRAIAEKQLRVASEQLTVAQRAADQTAAVLSALSTFASSLKLGPLSVLSPVQRLEESRKQYDAIVAAAKAGDKAAAASLPEIARVFLETSREVNASSLGFASDQASVQATLAALNKQYTTQLTAEQQMVVLLTAQVAAAEATIAAIADQVAAAQQAAADQIAAIQASAAAQLSKLGDLLAILIAQLEALLGIKNGIAGFVAKIPIPTPTPTVPGATVNPEGLTTATMKANVTAPIVAAVEDSSSNEVGLLQAGFNALAAKLDSVISAVSSLASAVARLGDGSSGGGAGGGGTVTLY